jgi:predicted RNA-binding Zn ribbon-like protein
MRAATEKPEEDERGDWIDGFLFVGNMPILDFLNTRPVLAEGQVELLKDFDALERWLVAAGIVNSVKTKRLLRSWRERPDATTLVAELIDFRERLRDAVLRIEAGAAPSAEFVEEINTGLLKHPPQTMLSKQDGRLVRTPLFAPQKPADLWAPLVDSAADLLSNAESHRVRKCVSCVLHFFDTSKKGSRRWCSMNICGNRLKVAAYQRRKRDGDA